MLIAARRDAQASGLQYAGQGAAHILDEQPLRVEGACVPVGYAQAEGLAQQGLACAQALAGTLQSQAVGVIGLHARQAVRAGYGVQPRRRRLDQHRVARAFGAEVQRIAAAGVIHVDVSAIEKQRAAFLGIAKRGVAAFLFQVVGLGLDNACRQPEIALTVADHLAEQVAGQRTGITVEKGGG